MENKDFIVDYVPESSRLSFLGNVFKKGVVKYATYKCSCGAIKDYRMYSVRSGRTLSCGCIKFNNPNKIKHGLTGHPLYKIWHSIKERCRNKNDKAYKNYGAKGIKMCDQWYNDFKLFFDWCILNGWEKGKTQVDKDVKPIAAGIKPYIYSPEWCSIVSVKVNSNNKSTNRRLTHKGKTQSLQMWAKELNIHPGTLNNRINTNNWDISKALETPVIIPIRKQRIFAIDKINLAANSILDLCEVGSKESFFAKIILEECSFLKNVSKIRQ